jgi:hypothetical protein
MMVKDGRPALQVKVDKQWQYVMCKVAGQDTPLTTLERNKAVHGRTLDYFRGEFTELRFRIERRPPESIPRVEPKQCEVIVATRKGPKLDAITQKQLDKISMAQAKIAYAEQTPPEPHNGYYPGWSYITNGRVAWPIKDKLTISYLESKCYSIQGWELVDKAIGMKMSQGHIVLKELGV